MYEWNMKGNVHNACEEFWTYCPLNWLWTIHFIGMDRHRDFTLFCFKIKDVNKFHALEIHAAGRLTPHTHVCKRQQGFPTCSCIVHMHLNMQAWGALERERGAEWWGKDSECCLLWTKTEPFCRQLVQAAEDESESSPLTGALVAPNPVRFHLVSLVQGKYEEKEHCTRKRSPPLPPC